MTPRVFLSHKKEDTEACEPIAEYLRDAGVDIYFDRYDRSLEDLLREGDADKITERIQTGLKWCSHMICVVSAKTVTSYWVPYEVGYGCRAEVILGILTLKGVDDSRLPEYMKTTKVIRGTRSLNEFVAELLGTSTHRLVEVKAIQPYSQLRHPLDHVLDWNR